jgi:plasmid stabilization system protein ParE
MIVRTTRRAKFFLTRLDAGLTTLSDHPHSGVECPELGAGVRKKVIGLTLVFYKAYAEEVVILRALDGRMDIDAEILK